MTIFDGGGQTVDFSCNCYVAFTLNDTWVLADANGVPPGTASAITANFNGTAIPGNDYVWFNSVMKLNGPAPSKLVSVFVTNASITFTNPATGATVTVPVPNGTVLFDPAATAASTTFTNGAWITRIPTAPSNVPGKNSFLAGAGFLVPSSGLPGGIQNVKWTAQFSTDTPGVNLNWQWAAAAYTAFSGDDGQLGAKPTDDNQASAYQNSDHAGTPENFKTSVTGGATGGGGSNYTGSLSGTATVTPLIITSGTN